MDIAGMRARVLPKRTPMDAVKLAIRETRIGEEDEVDE